MSDKEFDNLFKEKFRSFESQPSDAVWLRISEGLEGRGGRKSLSRIWVAAASVAVIVAASVWFYRPSEPMRLYGSKAGKSVTYSPQTQSDQIVRTEKKQENVLSKLSDLRVRSRKHIDSFKALRTQATAPAAERLETEGAPVVSAEARPADVSSEKLLTVKALPAPERLNIPQDHREVLAYAPETNIEKEEYQVESERTKPGIKSVGDLVNFVVSKVDKRKDKLIEFSDNDEGAQITGINLGLLKIKTKNNSGNRN